MIVKSYEELRIICKRNSMISERVVDGFLINYAAGHQGLEKKMEKQFDRFSHLHKKMGKEAVSRLPEASRPMLLDMIMLPAPIKEKGKKGYFPFALLLGD